MDDELQNEMTDAVTIFCNYLKDISQELDESNERQKKISEKMERRNEIVNKKFEEIDKKFEVTNQKVSNFKEQLEQILTIGQSNIGINKVRQAIWHSIHLSFP